MKLPRLLQACLQPRIEGKVAGAERPAGALTLPNPAGLPRPARDATPDELPMRRGVALKGLARLLDGGGVIGADQGQIQRGIKGSYTARGDEIQFYDDARGEHPLNIPPYVAGAMSCTPMNGQPTISGPFTGCTMAVYNDAGETRVAHVDTALPSEGEAPSKTRWAGMKEAPGFEVADELKTTGMLDAYLDTHPLDPSFATLSVVAAARPVEGIASHYVVKEGGDYRVID